MTANSTLERGRGLVQYIQAHPERNLGIDMRRVEARILHHINPPLANFIERWGTCRSSLRRGTTYHFAAMDTFMEVRDDEAVLWVNDDAIGQYEKAMNSPDTRILRHRMSSAILAYYRGVYKDILSQTFNPSLTSGQHHQTAHAVYDTVGPLLVVRGLI